MLALLVSAIISVGPVEPSRDNCTKRPNEILGITYYKTIIETEEQSCALYKKDFGNSLTEPGINWPSICIYMLCRFQCTSEWMIFMSYCLDKKGEGIIFPM